MSSTNAVQRKKQVVLEPLALGNAFEVALVHPPRALLTDLAPIFPDLKEPHKLLVCPTVQRSSVDLAGIGDTVENEKDRLLQTFVAWADIVTARLRAAGHWVDYIGPTTGMPALGARGSSGYSEVEGFEVLLNYRVQNVGCCKIILHPRWQSRMYPATLFTTAPAAIVKTALRGSVVEVGDTVSIVNGTTFPLTGRVAAFRTVDGVPVRAVIDLDWTLANGNCAQAFVAMQNVFATKK